MCKSCKSSSLNILNEWKPLTDKELHSLRMSLQPKQIYNNPLKSLATCPSTIQQNAITTVTLTPSGGTPPYTKLELLEDGIAVKILNGNFTGAQTVQYNFPNAGSHIFSSRVTDSCPTPQTGYETNPCTINVIASGQKYNCINQICVPDVNGIYSDLISCQQKCGGGISDCLNCDLTKNYCIMGQCIPKDYAMYGAIAIAALVILK